jgi:hypothetical protein
MNRTALFLPLAFLIFTGSAFAQTGSDREAIKRAAIDYAEGWYEGNAEKMEGSLSPDLAKRIVNVDAQSRSFVSSMSAMSLVQGTRRGFGKRTPSESRMKEVTILDVTGNAASVKLEMHEWIDYMHIGKVNGRWVIINVLWEMKSKR